jgi:hypothetical protein
MNEINKFFFSNLCKPKISILTVAVMEDWWKLLVNLWEIISIRACFLLENVWLSNYGGVKMKFGNIGGTYDALTWKFLH